MKRRRIIVGLIAVVFVGVVVAVVWSREREPVYQGRKLSEWLEHGSTTSDGSCVLDMRAYQETSEALQHMGTNAIPCLLGWVKYNPPHWKIRVWSHMVSMPRPFQNEWVMKNCNPLRLSHSHFLAAFGFAVLQGRASPAIPELSRLANDTRDHDTAGRARECLESIRRPAKIGQGTGFLFLDGDGRAWRPQTNSAEGLQTE